ncbi:HEPN domain-containing protein [Tardisphaera miroshnichenkoae]
MNADALRERASFFFELAKDEESRGKGDSAMLHCAQAVQAALKLYISGQGREVPDTFAISSLFEAIKDKPELYSVFESKRRYFDLMDDAYYGCRQFPSVYAPGDVKAALSAAGTIMEIALAGGGSQRQRAVP